MLQINNIINIVSTSTPCKIEDNQKIKEILIQEKFKPIFFNEKNVSSTKDSDNYFASCAPRERFLNFQKASENKDSKIIWCNRGGYGSADILPFLYQIPKPQLTKILIGFSDISTIATFVQQKWGWKVLYAPTLAQILNHKISQQSQQLIFDLIKGKIPELIYNLQLLKGLPNPINSSIVGGCVSVLSGNYATKNQLNWRNKILFLEDEGEDGERLDRYFTQIAQMINEKNARPKAILLGNFLEDNFFGKVNSQKINIAIANFCSKIEDIPIWQETSNSLGHSYNQKPLFFGTKTQIFSTEIFQKTLSKNPHKNLTGILSQKINLNFFK